MISAPGRSCRDEIANTRDDDSLSANQSVTNTFPFNELAAARGRHARCDRA